MKKIICFLLIITYVVLSGCSFPFTDRKFSTEKWIQTEDSQKYHYIKDLKDNYNLIGMTSQEVRELLGEPYDEKVKGQVGFEEYFKNNVVFETETGVEDW